MPTRADLVGTTRFVPFSRDPAFLLPPDAEDRLPSGDVAHVVVAAVGRVSLGASVVRPIPGGKARYHPRLLLARESGLLGPETVAIDGTEPDADASKVRPVRHDRAKQLRATPGSGIAALTARAEAADAQGQPDPQALPAEIARREALKAKLDAACARLEEQARTEAEAAARPGRPRTTRRRRASPTSPIPTAR